MWKRLHQALVSPIARAWLWNRTRDDVVMAAPTDPPVTHGFGPYPDQILLIGDNIVRGVGVASYDLALGGHLARRLAAVTGRGADVTTRGFPGFGPDVAADALGRENLQRFDAVVIMTGIRYIVSIRPIRYWRRDVARLMHDIAQTPRSLPVLVVGVAPFARSLAAPEFIATWIERSIERQNSEVEDICGQTGAARYVPFAPALTGIRLGRESSPVYESWAAALVPTIAEALASEAPERELERIKRGDPTARREVLTQLGVRWDEYDAAASRVVEMAQAMFGTVSASLDFVDADRSWVRGARIATDDVPRSSRVSYPIEAPGGEPVGELVVIDPSSRQFTPEDVAQLRALALRAQHELWAAAR